MSVMASQITSPTIVYSAIYSGADKRKHQSSALLALCEGNSPVTGEFPTQWTSNAKMFPFDDVVMLCSCLFPQWPHLSQISIFVANHYIVKFLHNCPDMPQRIQIYETNALQRVNSCYVWNAINSANKSLFQNLFFSHKVEGHCEENYTVDASCIVMPEKVAQCEVELY